MISTIADISKIEDDTSFAIALSNLVFYKAELVGFENLTLAEQTAYCVDGLEREVNNGGFEQFFYNSSGNYAQQTVQALERIGANDTARLVAQACSVFPAQTPASDQETRCRQLEELTDNQKELWRMLDGEFYLYRDNLTGLMRHFVAAHLGEFSSDNGTDNE